MSVRGWVEIKRRKWSQPVVLWWKDRLIRERWLLQMAGKMAPSFLLFYFNYYSRTHFFFFFFCWHTSPHLPQPLPSWLHHGSPSAECLSLLLMARLLALMHFKRTAAATPQSARLPQISTIFSRRRRARSSHCQPTPPPILPTPPPSPPSDSGHHLVPGIGRPIGRWRGSIMHCWS